MDTTLKRRMWTIAIVAMAHLILSVLFGCLATYHQVVMAGGILDNYDSFAAWGNFDLKAFFFLQPQFGLAFIFQPDQPELGLNVNSPLYHLTKFTLTFSIPLLVSIPFCSFFFGLFSTKLVGWFPQHKPLVTRHC